MTKEQQQLAEEIFSTVYGWGTWGVKVEADSETYQTMIGQLLGNKYNGEHKVGKATLKCYIAECKKEHTK